MTVLNSARTLLLACLADVVLNALPVRADMPLFNGIQQTRSIGPRTEAVDLERYQHVLYVVAGHDDGDGSNASPFATIQNALESIQRAGDENRYAILVAGGKYQSSELGMKEHVDLFGGFDRDWKRDIFANATVLDAQHSGRVIRGADHSRLDGFIITNGRSKSPGGAIICEHVSPVISNNIIRGNATVEPESFRRDMIHQRGTDGGAIAILTGSNTVVRNNVICENTTGIGNGGGIYIWNESKPHIISNVMCNNRTGLSGEPGKEGSRSSNGGGIAVSKDCQPQIIGNVIAMNTVADNSDAGGIYLEYDANAHVKGNWIVGNFGQDDGGGMYVMKNSEPVVEYNVFAGNRNTTDGSGGIRLSKEGRMRASHNLFAGNPSAIDLVDGWMILRNNTFVDSITNAIVYENGREHLMPSRVEGNVFAGKSKLLFHLKPSGARAPQFSMNHIPGANGDQAELFIDDSIKGTIAGRTYGPDRHVTTIQVSGAQIGIPLAGRVINVGGQWSVIQSSTPDQINVWGHISDPADSFLIQCTYRLSRNSPANGLGAYAAN